MSAPARLLVYGATGHTGELVAAEAAARGLGVVLAGRDAGRLATLSAETGFETRAVALEDANGLREALEDVAAVLHLAVPFSATATPMLDACLATGTHYLDVNGELDVFQAIARRDAEAREAGVALVPGVGFHVVPTDCLAAHTAIRVPDPQRIHLVIAGMGPGVARSAARLFAESLRRGVAIRRDGVITTRPIGRLQRTFDFGAGPIRAIGLPLGDVATAFHSTGAPNVETYAVAHRGLPRALRVARLLAPLLRREAVQTWIETRLERGADDAPADTQPEGTRATILAEVESAEGGRARTMLETPSPSAFTATAALAALRRIAEAPPSPGYHTPATAFGADFVLALDGCKRHDLDAEEGPERVALRNEDT
ncbi:MAG: saccharopine dehydrogenase NADP-binding domain-containing protein [Myxococcota bacterium]